MIEVNYFLRYQLLTLTVIESPGEGFQSSKKSDEKGTGVFAKEGEAQDIYEKATNRGNNDVSKKTIPITSGIRRAARFLYALGGFSRFYRGARPMLLCFCGNAACVYRVSDAAISCMGPDNDDPRLRCRVEASLEWSALAEPSLLTTNGCFIPSTNGPT